MTVDPLEAALQSYYWKPAIALFRAIELRKYAEAGVHLNDPVLDLGCGDGQVARMLARLDLADEPLCGLDLSARAVAKAQRSHAHRGLLRGDATSLPFRSESFAAVVSNGVLCCIPTGVETALAEIHRVLRPGGLFVGTVPTDRFVDLLLWPKLLERLSPALRDLYVRRFNRRLLHFVTPPPDQWQARFAEQGLRVIRCEGFFSRRTGQLWSVLTAQAFRALGALKAADSRLVADGASALWRKLLTQAVVDDPKGGPPFGYLFLVAQKDRRG